MRVIYETPIWEQINSAKLRAEHEGRRIEKIVLTEQEMEGLRRHMDFVSRQVWNRQFDGPLHHYDGILLEVE